LSPPTTVQRVSSGSAALIARASEAMTASAAANVNVANLPHRMS
jgi:hypothetical protein